jgi:serine/threonine-protein kinase
VLGEEHRETLRARDSAALLFGRQHKQREAAEQFAAIVARDREILRPEDPQLSREMYNWAATLQNSGDNEAAEPILRDLLRLIDEHGLAYLEFVPAARNALAKVLEEKGEYEEADRLFQAALAERRRRFPSASREIAYSLSDYGEAMLERGDPEGAEPLLAELVEMEQELVGPDDWELASARYLHGHCLAKLGHYEEAEPVLIQACEAFARSCDALPSAARLARAGILDLYAAWDMSQPGHGIGKRAARWQAKFPAEE